MKSKTKAALLLLLPILLSSCTHVRYGDFRYTSVLQDKNFTYDPDTGKVVYSTTSDPAIEAFKLGLEAGAP